MISLQGDSEIMTTDTRLTAWRGACAVYVDGKPILRGGAQFTFLANVQPLNGRQLLLVPEADRFKEQYMVFSECTVLVEDIIPFRNGNFQVQNVEAWGSFNQARMMRIDVGPLGGNP